MLQMIKNGIRSFARLSVGPGLGLGLLLTLVFSGCDPGLPSSSIRLEFNFNPAQGWTSGFADLPVADKDIYELDSGWSTIPASAGGGNGFFLTGNNHSDDLFMFLKYKVTGLKPGITYTAKATLKLASNAPTEAVGIGGAPGESVYLKFGAMEEEPVVVNNAGFLEMNIDKGNQAIGSDQVIVMGHIGVAPEQVEYKLISRSGSVTFTTGIDGSCWLLLGTDSGYEGTTALYYKELAVTFQERLPD